MLICPNCGKPLTQRFVPVQDRRKGAGWICEDECGKFIIRSKVVEEAVRRAYAAVDVEAVKEKAEGRPITAGLMLEYKEHIPTMDSVEYYWVDDLIDHIEIGKHELTSDKIRMLMRMKQPVIDDRTITVYWRCGIKTTVESGVTKDSDNPAYVARLMDDWRVRNGVSKPATPVTAGEVEKSGVEPVEPAGVDKRRETA